MGAITFRTINDAIETALSAATGLAKSESYDELTDGVMDYPLLQVYYQSHTVDPTGPTDRSAFGGAVRVWEILYHADLYAAQRGDLAENMDAVMAMVDEIDQELEKQTTSHFGRSEIKALSWRAERVLFRADESSPAYPGVRFYITVRVF